MKSSEFIKRIKDVVTTHRTVYMWGTFGQLVTDTLIKNKDRQYDAWYTKAIIGALEKLIGKSVYAFDCVGLIKGILWGWDGKEGSAKYGSNKVPDVSANGMLSHLKDVSTNFNVITPGEAVWMDGHIGVYIGDGMVAECTPAWHNNCQFTALENVGRIPGLKSRKWTKHGKLPWVEYEDIPKPPAKPVEEPKPATDEIYIVKSGDTLSAIAAKYKVTLVSLVKYNGITNANLIRVGQKIKIPKK